MKTLKSKNFGEGSFLGVRFSDSARVRASRGAYGVAPKLGPALAGVDGSRAYALEVFPTGGLGVAASDWSVSSWSRTGLLGLGVPSGVALDRWLCPYGSVLRALLLRSQQTAYC